MSNVPKAGETTDDQSLLGRRDAFHVPSILVKSYSKLKPGQRVRFTDNSFTEVVPVKDKEIAHAIVDPFVDKGFGKRVIKDLFYVWMLPGTVTNLVHHYNVDIDDVPAKYVEPVESDEDQDDSCKGCYH